MGWCGIQKAGRGVREPLGGIHDEEQSSRGIARNSKGQARSSRAVARDTPNIPKAQQKRFEGKRKPPVIKTGGLYTETIPLTTSSPRQIPLTRYSFPLGTTCTVTISST